VIAALIPVCAVSPYTALGRNLSAIFNTVAFDSGRLPSAILLALDPFSYDPTLRPLKDAPLKRDPSPASG